MEGRNYLWTFIFTPWLLVFFSYETGQDPAALAPHVLCLPFVCRKTLAKECV